MSIPEQLYRRALRILADGNDHELAALRWAGEMTQERQVRAVEDLQRQGFSLREISVGIQLAEAP